MTDPVTDPAIADPDYFNERAATFGDRLEAARDAASLSQDDFARKLGVSLHTVEAWEENLSEPRSNRLQIMAGLLGVSIKWLLTGVSEGQDGGSGLPRAVTDVDAVLADLRDTKAQMLRLAEHVGGLERRLKNALADA